MSVISTFTCRKNCHKTALIRQQLQLLLLILLHIGSIILLFLFILLLRVIQIHLILYSSVSQLITIFFEIITALTRTSIHQLLKLSIRVLFIGLVIVNLLILSWKITWLTAGVWRDQNYIVVIEDVVLRILLGWNDLRMCLHLVNHPFLSFTYLLG